MIAAVQAHADLLGDLETWADPFKALNAAGVFMKGQSMGGPQGKNFGMYIGPEGGVPGVLLNTRFDETALRHTAAHELAHHRFDHGTQLHENVMSLEALGRGSWPMPEKTAEAFAAWFLMPLTVVDAALAGLGLRKITQAEQVYQLSLWLGTSYRGTVRQLANLHKISGRQADIWSASAPAAMRQRLDTDRPSLRHWSLGPHAAGHRLHVRPGDQMTIDLGIADLDAVSAPAGVTVQPDPGDTLIPVLRLRIDSMLEAEADVGLGDDWHITLVPSPDCTEYIKSFQAP